MNKVHLADSTATLNLGRDLASNLQPGMVVYLTGELGVGKTTLVRGILGALGHKGSIKSPTYTLVEPYELLTVPVYHFDCYRLLAPEELEFLGVREYFDGTACCIIEWPEKGKGYLAEPDMEVELFYDTTGEGRIAVINDAKSD